MIVMATTALPMRDSRLVAAARADRLLISLLGRRIEWGSDDAPVDVDIERNRTRERIRLVHSVMARRQRRRTTAPGGRHLP